MRKIATTLALFALSTQLIQAQSPTQPALGFNVFLQKSAYLSTNETEGPMAIGEDLTLAGNYQVSTHSSGNFFVGGIKVSLLIGGKVLYQSGNSLQVNQNGYVKIGDSLGSYVWYKDPNQATPPIQITSGANYNSSPRIQMQANSNQLGVSALINPVFQGNLIDFVTAFSAMKATSTAISNCSNNATLTDPNGNAIPNTGLPNQVKINLNNGINYLNVTGADLNNVQVFTYNQQPSANKVLVINVNAPGNFVWNVWNQAGIGFNQCPYIIYNFYNTTDLNIAGNSTIEGTVFAPYADVKKTINQSNIEGQVIAQSFMHSGGEVHFAPFTPHVTGCLPTMASFNINNATQCIYDNHFDFTSNSTGSGVLVYNWSFGDGNTSTMQNPSHVYANSGNYHVKLVVTGSNGVDSITQIVHVIAKPVVGFNVNDTVQMLTGNSFVFTTTNPDINYTYEWCFDDPAPHVHAVNASHSYASTGAYLVSQYVADQYGCMDTGTLTVYVACDSVGSGNGGGLESESLGDLVSKRDFAYLKNSISRRVDYATSPAFALVYRNSYLGKTSGLLTLADMIPAQLENGSTSVITSPNDLTTITSALEVVSVDYLKNNQAKAVVLGIKTKTKAYSHAKYICDRLRGAKLVSVETKRISGYDFARYTLMQDDGTLEFGTSFVVGYTAGEPGYSLQTNWLLGQILGSDTMYNFQVWANIPEYADKLVADIIAKVKTSSTITVKNTLALPKVYITRGYREGENLVLHVNNNGAPIVAQLQIEAQMNEQAGHASFSKTANIKTGNDNVIEVKVNDGYEYSIDLFTNNMIEDVVYMADGNWSLDYDKTYTVVNDFSTANEPNRIYNSKDLSVYRNANVSATGDDYILLYKGIKQGNAPANLTNFTDVTFFAKGKGTVTVSLNRDSIVNWKAQYKHDIVLTETGKQYTIALADFKSDLITTAFNPNDVRMITFLHGYSDAVGVNMEMNVGNLSFIRSKTGLIKNASSDNKVKLSVVPNPNNGNFTLNFTAPKAEKVKYIITDILGKEVTTGYINATEGANETSIKLGDNNQSKGLFFVNLESKLATYQTVKVIAQ